MSIELSLSQQSLKCKYFVGSPPPFCREDTTSDESDRGAALGAGDVLSGYTEAEAVPAKQAYQHRASEMRRESAQPGQQ
jgi:hypothetical protein